MLNDRDYMRTDAYEPESRRPRTAVAWLILINAAVLVIALFADEMQGRSGFGGASQSWRSILSFRAGDLLSPNAWTFLTSMFAHDGFAHLFFNMMTLYVCGREVERCWGRSSLSRCIYSLAQQGPYFSSRCISRPPCFRPWAPAAASRA